MNPKIKKVIDEIDRTKAKITELQNLLPELERKRIDMENTEIIKLVRSADILPAELPAFLESLKTPKELAAAPATAHQLGQLISTGSGDERLHPGDEDDFNNEPSSDE